MAAGGAPEGPAARSSQKAGREVVTRTLADAAAVRDAIAAPRAQIQKLHAASDLVILNVIWPLGMTVMPHNHNMWSIVAVYDGREDNIFWRRMGNTPGGRIEAAGAEALSTGECAILGPALIHSVTNPSARFSGAIRVYGGDFFNAARSEWDPDTLLEGPYSAEKTMRLFEEANRRTVKKQPISVSVRALIRISLPSLLGVDHQQRRVDPGAGVLERALGQVVPRPAVASGERHGAAAGAAATWSAVMTELSWWRQSDIY